MTWLVRTALFAGTLGCLVAPPAGAQAVPDMPPGVTHVASGGTWRFGTASGHYRLVIMNSTVNERDSARVVSQLVIQWIEVNGGRPRVRTTQTSTVIGEPWTLDAPVFQTGGSRTVVWIDGRSHHDGHTARWIVSLGAPGQFSVSAPKPSR